MCSMSPVTHLHHPPLWPIIMAHPPTNSHVFNVFKGVLSTLLSPPHLAHLIQTWSGLTPTCRSLTFVSCPPHYVSCSAHPTHLVRSWSGLTCASCPPPTCTPHWVLVGSLPMCMPLTCASFPPPYVSSPMHP